MALNPVTELEALVDALNGDGVPYALCGGLALGIHGHPRTTIDIDLLVEAADVSRALVVAKRVGFDILDAGARRLSVVSREGLATMKRIAGRAQDLADLARLEGTDDDEG